MSSAQQKRASVSLGLETDCCEFPCGCWALNLVLWKKPSALNCCHSFSLPMAAFKVGFHYYFKFLGEVLKLDHLFNVIKVKALGVVEILVQMCLLQNQMFLYSAGYGIILTSILDQATH